MIEVKNLQFTYKNALEPAIKGIDFSLSEGEVFGFLGPSGAGKSTTQKLLIKLLTGYKGSVKVMGENLSAFNNDYYNMIGVGFELPNHYLKLTARENLLFFSSFYMGKTKSPEDLLSMVDLIHDIDVKVGEFSKGMKMRLNFVRALMHDPQIYFFDEPTSGLDPVNAQRIKDIILELKSRGKTIFLTTHNMHDADELCDRVAFIVNGKLNMIDTPNNLKLINGKRKVSVEYGEGKLLVGEYNLDTIGEDEEFMSIIKKEKIISIHSKESSLNDVFIKTTGIKL